MPDSDVPSNPTATPRRAGPLPVIALIVALGALGLAGWAAFKPMVKNDATPVYSEAAQAAAKTKLCTAVDVVRKGVSMNTNLQPPGGDADVTGALAVGANARVALSGGGQYLLAKIDPAAPQQLSDDARALANTLLDIGAAAIAGALNTDPDQAARLQEADSLNANLVTGCA